MLSGTSGFSGFTTGAIILALAANFILGMPYASVLFMALGVQILLGIIDYASYKSKAYDYARAMYNAYITGAEYERE